MSEEKQAEVEVIESFSAVAKPGVTIDRLNVIFSMSHEHCCDDPFSVDRRFALLLKGDDQSYMRRIQVKEEFIKLDTGWVEDASILIVLNNSRVKHNLTPSAEERALLDRQFLRITTDRTLKGAVAGTGRFFYAEVESGSEWWIGSSEGTIDAVVIAIPK